MNIEIIERVLAAKREVHSELAEPLTWAGFRRILSRERLSLIIAPSPTPARLVQFDSTWTIAIDSKLPPQRYLAYGVHELGHMWVHVEPGLGRYEPCMNFSYGESKDPREEEAEYLGMALMYGPRYFGKLIAPMKYKPAKPVAAKVPAGSGEFALPVVGTAHRQKELESICGPRRPDGYTITLSARVRPEDDNQFDSMAVAVEIAGKLVGYLSRAEARSYRARYGEAQIHCAARITGGWDRGGGMAGHFGVRLDLILVK